MTLTALYMQQRGTKLDTDFRYLTDGWGEGKLKGEYLNSDKNIKMILAGVTKLSTMVLSINSGL